jgi:predicted transposase YbfD/YdcC
MQQEGKSRLTTNKKSRRRRIMKRKYVVLSLKRLMELAVEIPDARRTTYGNNRHLLLDVLAIVLIAMMCGYTTWEDMHTYATTKAELLKQILKLKHGIPSVSTIRRVINSIKAEELESVYRKWVMPYIGSCAGKQLNIDGKEVRGVEKHGEAVLNNVSVWISEEGISLGQEAVEEKSNEITAIPILLNDLEIKGSIVSIDAMGCQKNIAETIRLNGADYILALKGNQKGFYRDVVEYFEWAKKDKVEQRIIEKATGRNYEHGRITHWKAEVTYDAESFEESKEWKDIKSIIKISRIVTNGKEPREETRYYISSLKISAVEFMKRIRGHWSIENNLHWELDTQYGEDACRIHKGEAPRNISLLRKIVMAMAKAIKKPGLSYHSIQVKASLCDEFMMFMLYNQ